MRDMRLFIDTHDLRTKTFPAGLDAVQFEGFFAAYEKACREEDVVPVRTHVALEAGRAFCLTLAPDAEAVRRAHARVGLPFDEIVEVKTAAPSDMFFRKPAA